MARISETLISKEQIDTAIKAAAKEVDERYRGKPLLFLSLLNGAFIFAADFMRSVTIPCEITFMKCSSYGSGDTSSGCVKVDLDTSCDLSKYHVVILEDIIDTGYTLEKVCTMLKDRDPLSLEIITLLDKPSRRVNGLKPDKALFTIEDKFVIGYGLDFDNKYRNLPYIGVYDPEGE